jgi:glycosyltransferase involved in cell wall biosynthesis
MRKSAAGFTGGGGGFEFQREQRHDGIQLLKMDLSELKICFLAGTLGQGGAERQLFYNLRALRQNGAVPRVLCLAQNEFWEEPIRNLGVPVTCVGQMQSKLTRLLRIMVELRKRPPKILQSQHFYTNSYVAAAARALRLCGIGALRGNGLSEVQDSGPIGGWLSLHAPRVIAANSRSGIQYAVRKGVCSKRLHFLPNVVDTTHFCPGGLRREHAMTLLIAGRLAPEKRVDRFLDLLARIRSKAAVPARGIIVGDGPLRKSLEERAACLGLMPPVVEFRGSVSDLLEVYRESDIFVLTSDSEGTPNVLLEASGSGLPIVATRTGDATHVVRDGETGFLCNCGDEEALVSAVLRLAGDEELRRRVGAQGRRFVEENYSSLRLAQFLTDFYTQVLP